MTDLEMFLELPDVDSIVEEVYVSDRLPKFKVKAMTAQELRDYQNKCKIKSKKGVELDTGKFNLLVVAGQVVSPDFSNAEFLKKANCATASQFIEKKLLAGEIANLGKQIVQISGFDNDINEDIEEAKN